MRTISHLVVVAVFFGTTACGTRHRLPVLEDADLNRAKEALAKALGAPAGLRWTDCEVLSDETGRPSLLVAGTVADRVSELGISRLHVSISHDAGVAVAMVVCEG